MKKTNESFNAEIQSKFNNDITVLDAYIDKRTKITFHCNKCGIDFVTSPQSILRTKYGCPECAIKSMSATHIKNHTNSKYGMLVDIYPDIAKRWDYVKNIDLNIDDMTIKSGKRVWWICSQCDQSYQAKVCSIVNGSQRWICHRCYVKTIPQVKVDSYINEASYLSLLKDMKLSIEEYSAKIKYFRNIKTALEVVLPRLFFCIFPLDIMDK